MNQITHYFKSLLLLELLQGLWLTFKYTFKPNKGSVFKSSKGEAKVKIKG